MTFVGLSLKVCVNNYEFRVLGTQLNVIRHEYNERRWRILPSMTMKKLSLNSYICHYRSNNNDCEHIGEYLFNVSSICPFGPSPVTQTCWNWNVDKCSFRRRPNDWFLFGIEHEHGRGLLGLRYCGTAEPIWHIVSRFTCCYSGSCVIYVRWTSRDVGSLININWINLKL